MKLRYRVAAYLSWRTIVIRNAFGTFLKTSSNDSGLTINLSDDQDWADNARRQTLQNNCLVVVNWDLRPVVGEGNSIWRRRGIILLRRWRRWSVES
jgi:hypothetical protein